MEGNGLREVRLKKEDIKMVDSKKALEDKKFYDMERDGVTQSMLSMWLTCRMKARLYIQGWDPKYTSPSLIYGSIGHSALELAYLDIKAKKLSGPPSVALTRKYITETERRWMLENPKPNKESQQYLETSLALIDKTVPQYFEYWKDDFKKKEWVSLEEKFVTELKVPDGEGGFVVIPVRGKKDGVFLSNKGLWLFETKFKSMINEDDIVETLAFETQVMLYLWSLWTEKKELPRGVLYNIVRRTSLRQGVNESLIKFAQRVAEDMKSRPDFYFIRMESAIIQDDLEMFKKELVKIVGDMYAWWKGIAPHYRNTYSCVGKYGRCSYLPVCGREDYSGLIKRKTMFKELQDL